MIAPATRGTEMSRMSCAESGSSEDDEGKAPLTGASDGSKLRSCAGRYCSCYERMVAVLLPVCALINLCFGVAIDWAWGIFLGISGLFLGALVAHHVSTQFVRKAAVGTRERSTRAAVLMLFIALADFIFPYILLTAVVQVAPQNRRPQWAGLHEDGFPTQCRLHARNCVRMANGSDIYASGLDTNLRPPVISGSRAQVLDQVEHWVRSHGGHVVLRTHNVMRSRFTTFFMGYQDDLACQVVCLDSGRVQLNLQSQSRLGIRDFDVNLQRVRALVGALKRMCPVKSTSQGVQISDVNAKRRNVPGSAAWDSTDSGSLLRKEAGAEVRSEGMGSRHGVAACDASCS